MSIAATIHSVETLPNGHVKIYLRPISKGEVAGQKSLTITNWPNGQSPYGLVGTNIWGGCGEIMIGERRWAERRGYKQIVLTTPPECRLTEDRQKEFQPDIGAAIADVFEAGWKRYMRGRCFQS